MSQYPWLLLIVYVVTVGVVQLLALWAASSTKPWLLRAMVVWGAIVLLLPIRVYEPALLLTMSAVLTIGLERAVRRFARGREAGVKTPYFWRFHVADLLALVMFIATPLAIATQFISTQLAIWTLASCAALATPIAAISVLAYRVVVGVRRKSMLLLLLSVIWISAILMRVFGLPLSLNGGSASLGYPLMNNELYTLGAHGAVILALTVCVAIAAWAWKLQRKVSGSTSGSLTRALLLGVALAMLPLNWLAWDLAIHTTLIHRLLEASIHSIPLHVLAGIVGLSSLLAKMGWSGESGWKQRAARSAALTLTALVASPAAWLYWQMLWQSPYPALSHGHENHFERIMAIGDRMQGYTNSMVPLPANLQAELDEAVILLQSPNYMPPGALEAETQIDGWRDAPLRHDYFSLFQRLAQAAVNAQQARKPDRAADYAVAIVRYATMFERGTTTQHVWGICPTEVFGYRILSTHRHELSSAKARETIRLLQKSLGERDTDEQILTRDKVHSERSGGWRSKLHSILSRLRNDPEEPSTSIIAVYQERKRWEAINRLLQADLAIRLFESAQGRLPQSLQELSPKLVPEMPVDPYSGQAIIYRPRDGGFDLYCVGPDGVDDGGKSCRFAPPPDVAGFDLGLQ